jgi:hypothetical protein
LSDLWCLGCYASIRALAQKCGICWMIQNAATLPMAYGGMRQAHAGFGIEMCRVTCRASEMTAKTDEMNKADASVV